MNYKSRTHVDLHVIDAIGEEWLKSGHSEALMLRYFLRHTKILIVSHLAWDVQSLQRVISQIADFRATYRNPRKAVPYVHISCHGTKRGLRLGDAPLVAWDILSKVLLPLQRTTDYHVSLSLSSCWGYYGAQLADGMDPQYEKRRPYYSLVGPKDEENIVELCKTFGYFYTNLLVRFKSLKRSIEIANQEGKTELDYTYGSVVVP